MVLRLEGEQDNSPEGGGGWLPRAGLTPFSFVKISMCSYVKAGQPGS